MSGEGVLIPNVPVSVWDQMGVVVLYTLLLIIIGGLLIRHFTKSVDQIEERHQGIVRGLSDQFVAIVQAYDHRITEQAAAFGRLVVRLEDLGRAIDRIDRSVQHLVKPAAEPEAAPPKKRTTRRVKTEQEN